MTAVALTVPSPEFAISGVEAEPNAATPLLRFAVSVTDRSGRDVYTIAATARVQIDADRRAYDPETRRRLLDLFGEAERIPATAGSLQLGRVDTLVPSFSGDGAFTVALPVSADLELAAGRYLASLPGGCDSVSTRSASNGSGSRILRSRLKSKSKAFI